ncbi:MAG: asparagine synthase (glutamine-hydrolyzing) [Cytophagia bacterium]|nr:MAG: asparagine synthase (glutamine-hydrolyzing) [Cytophagia bacterium]TAG37917.1 MAG: asparagine synthase (glutamine-hydrolyzing) [Cytophagia bacterium]
MCGINFFLDKNKLQNDSIIQAMNNAILHRGNENTAFFQKDNFYFGHNRLKILDTSTEANQPFFSEDKRYVLIFNGEIYNHQLLKKELSKKYVFKTHTDTEVLLYFLIENKNESELNGIYAYIFVDLKEKNIKYSRDKLGIKPLYIFENNDYLLLSSEIKGIIASGLVTKKINYSQIIPYIHQRFVDKNQSFFENIIPIPIATTSIHNHNPIQKKNFSDKNELQQLDVILGQVVHNQCFADVPVGLFLSGGIDSTLLLAYLQENNYPKPTAFTIIHEKKDIQFVSKDTYFAEKAAKKFGANWEPVLINATILDNFQEFVAKIDNPIADAAFLLIYHLAEKASKTHKVVLTGAGADEMFGGYYRHQAFYRYLQLKKIFGKYWIRLFKNIPTQFLSRKWKKLVEKIDENTQKTFINFTQTHWNYNKHHNKNDLIDDVIIQNNELKWALEYEKNHFLSEDVLKINDLAAMLHSVEVRVPFLDNQVIDFVDNLATKFLLKNGKKWLLKQLLINKGGKEFANRSKEGFGMAFGEWIRQKKYSDLIINTLHKKNTIFDELPYPIFNTIWQLHQNRKADFTNEIFGIWFLAEWLHQNT